LSTLFQGVKWWRLSTTTVKIRFAFAGLLLKEELLDHRLTGALDRLFPASLG
jgi:hypothetical protein